MCVADLMFRRTIKRNLNDYKKEMKELESKYHALDKKASSQVDGISSAKRERAAKVLSSSTWSKLVPVVMAIAMAVLTLIFLVISEALKNH